MSKISMLTPTVLTRSDGTREPIEGILCVIQNGGRLEGQGIFSTCAITKSVGFHFGVENFSISA